MTSATRSATRIISIYQVGRDGHVEPMIGRQNGLVSKRAVHAHFGDCIRIIRRVPSIEPGPNPRSSCLLACLSGPARLDAVALLPGGQDRRMSLHKRL